jgi:hypothetical protein
MARPGEVRRGFSFEHYRAVWRIIAHNGTTIAQGAATDTNPRVFATLVAR